MNKPADEVELERADDELARKFLVELLEWKRTNFPDDPNRPSSAKEWALIRRALWISYWAERFQENLNGSLEG